MSSINVRYLHDPELTGDAQDVRRLPSAHWQAPDQRVQPLLVTRSAAVTHHCVGLISLSNLPKNGGLPDSGRRSTRGCGRFTPPLNSEARRLEVGVAALTHRCPSCRCKRGGSCRARRSSVRRRATPSPRSLHRTGSSCLAAPCTSSHRAARTEKRDHETLSEAFSCIID